MCEGDGQGVEAEACGEIRCRGCRSARRCWRCVDAMPTVEEVAEDGAAETEGVSAVDAELVGAAGVRM